MNIRDRVSQNGITCFNFRMVSSIFADRKALVLFDVDNTLTLARQSASPEMLQVLKDLRKQVAIGFVSGSDLVKVLEQLGANGILAFCSIHSSQSAQLPKSLTMASPRTV